MKKYFRKAVGRDNEIETSKEDMLIALSKHFVNPKFGLALLEKDGELTTEQYTFEYREVEEKKESEEA